MALPDRPDEAQLRRRARELQRAARAGDPDAQARLQAHGLSPTMVGLRQAQHVLAREMGHRSWSGLLAALAAGSRTGGERRSAWDPAEPAVRPPLLAPLVAAAVEVAGQLGSNHLATEHLVLLATDPEGAGHVELADGGPPRRLIRPAGLRSTGAGGGASAPGSLAAHRAAGQELLAAVVSGDPAAAARVLAAHPIYAGRDPGRLDPTGLRLADGYATVAAEAGFASWPELVAAVESAELGVPRRRWAGSHSARALGWAMASAGRRRDPGVRPAHIVLALLYAPPPDRAADVLDRLGVSVESVTDRLGPEGDPADTVGVGSTPTWHALMGWAAGLALGRGADRVEPPDVLLALAYGLPPGDVTDEVGADPDAVHDALADLGHPVPPIVPSEVWSPKRADRDTV